MKTATQPKLDKNSAQIFTNVCVAMQGAEEATGPEGDDYLELMDAIIAECDARKVALYLRDARKHPLQIVPPPGRKP